MTRIVVARSSTFMRHMKYTCYQIRVDRIAECSRSALRRNTRAYALETMFARKINPVLNKTEL